MHFPIRNLPLSNTTDKNLQGVESWLDFDLEDDDFEFEKSGIEAALNDFSDQQLCIPCDPINELEWFPNFNDEYISLNRIPSCDEAAEFRYSRTSRNPENSIMNDSKENFSSLTPQQKNPEKSTMNDSDSKDNFSGILRNKKLRTKRLGGSRAWESLNNHFPSAVETGVAVVERKCSHCQVDKTPQWRTGPLGPKTLCNACGVRFKSGRLVPEYRPVASPSFDMQVHSNSHKRIIKMRELLKDGPETSYSWEGNSFGLENLIRMQRPFGSSRD